MSLRASLPYRRRRGFGSLRVANRLTEDGRDSVLVLEYGGSDRSLFLHMPAALSIPLNKKKFNRGYFSEPEPHLDGRRIACPRGKALGGSSSIIGRAYVRGHPLDFHRSESQGAKGWVYRNILPYFRRAENYAGGATHIAAPTVRSRRGAALGAIPSMWPSSRRDGRPAIPSARTSTANFLKVLAAST